MAKSKKRKKKVTRNEKKITTRCLMCNGLAPHYVIKKTSTKYIENGVVLECKQCGQKWVKEKN